MVSALTPRFDTMALAMSRPFTTKQGSYYLNVKVPLALRSRAKGQRVSLPVADAHHTVVVGEKVVLSLRTKDPETAKIRFRKATQALAQFFEAIAQGPSPLTRTQRVALAGDIYRDAVRELDTDDRVLDAIEATTSEFDANVTHHLGTPGEEDPVLGAGRPADEKTAELMAAIDMYDARALAAWAAKHEPDPVKRRVALELLYGRLVDDEMSRKQIQTDTASRQKTIEATDQMADAFADLAQRRLSSMDFSDPFGDGLPIWTQPKSIVPASGKRVAGDTLAVEKLFGLWKDAHETTRSASTLRRYGFSIDALIAFWGQRDVRLLTHADVWDWARERQKTVPAATINKNDLVAVSSVLGWATTHLAQNLLTSNPAEKVKLPEDKKTIKREKRFRDSEIAAILLAARQARHNPKAPRASASRRWAAWICAYRGCRIQEICWVTKDDIYRDGEIWMINFPKTKVDIARRVPLHPALIEEGLLAFHAQAPSGFLFCGDVAQKPGATRSQQEQRASELSEWVREQVTLDPSLSPNHGWRHTFISRADAAGISKRASNAITGHNTNRDTSDGYYDPSAEELKAIIDRYPRYNLAA